jgi:hypothetical protein
VEKGAGRVRAATVRVREQYVMAKHGKLARETYRANASKDLLHVLVTPGDFWVDFPLFVESTELVCRLFAAGNPGLARKIGAFGAEANIGSWRSIVYRLMPPRLVMELAGAFWSHHYDGGRLNVTLEGRHSVVARLEDFPRPHLIHCLSISGWMERTIELGRPKRVAVTERTCRTRGDAACEFLIDWE